jgi:hypothetical protein
MTMDNSKRDGLNKWLSETGILRDSICVGNCGAFGEGLVAKQNISPNQEILMEIPLSLQIREQTALQKLGKAGLYIEVCPRPHTEKISGSY